MTQQPSGAAGRARPVTLAIVGPTACGKSALSLQAADLLGAEVVNADAFQLYRGMDVGTAKLTPTERGGVPHHQIDVLDLHEDASVAAYQRHARADADAVRARGARPLYVGGSGLYVRAALDRLEIPPTDPGVRARIQAEADESGLAPLRERLERLDPEAAAAIEPNNARRIVRALEVIELTGRPFSATMPRREYLEPALVVGLRVPRIELDARIEARTRGMWASGLLDEVAALEERGLSRTRTASRAVGYAQALDQLGGRLTQDEAIEATAAATRRLVRRQESWFGADPRVVWLDAATDGTAADAARVTERLARQVADLAHHADTAADAADLGDA